MFYTLSSFVSLRTEVMRLSTGILKGGVMVNDCQQVLKKIWNYI